jgi:flavin reductase (DIM6/NTAB) family NADH-FMN oxidoreductase RutF/ubiquinone/menaquinone biosynthesis C-methylase UbiE
MGFDSAEFRRVLGHFATGVTVVTTAHKGVLQGMTVNSFSSVSLDPPLVLFCADKRALTHAAIQASGIFAVNLLAEPQRAVSDLFAGKANEAERHDLLAATARISASGSPIIAGALGFIDCTVSATHDAGDHVIYVGAVVEAGRGETAAPLLYYRGTYQALGETWRWSDRYSVRERSTRYDEMADFFERMEAEGPYGALLNALAALGAPSREARCLDIGCGAGRLARELAARAREAVGVDVSTRMLERARSRAHALGIDNASYREARAEELPFEAGSFDLVTAANLLSAVAEPATALREAARVLRPGGRLALLEPTVEMRHASMSAFLKKHEVGAFAARALLAWSDAAAARQPHDEATLAADLRAAGLEPVTEALHLDGLARLSLVERR